jgi:triphosphoribosyl-dephospho-CoA synthetase
MTAIADRLATSSSLRSRLRACRSFLLTPGSRPENFIAARAGDGIIIDLDYVRAYAGDPLEEGGAFRPDGVRKMAVFDNRLFERHLSPGGSADLLAVTWFLAQVPLENTEAR